MQKRHYNPTIVKQHMGSGTIHLIYHFENGYGASVIPEYDSLAYSKPYFVPIPGLLELAVLKYTGTGDIHDDSNWDICYDSPITDHVIRRITQPQVDELLDRIASL